jgi:hypothetical protein
MSKKRKPVKLIEGENGFMQVVAAVSPKQYEENEVHLPIARILEKIEAAGVPLLFFHIPNGGKRTKAAAGRLKAMGVKAGMPDIPIVLPEGRMLWIELKYTGSYLRKDQKAIHAKLRALGHIVITITATDSHDAQRQIFKVLDEHGVQTKGKVARIIPV